MYTRSRFIYFPVRDYSVYTVRICIYTYTVDTYIITYIHVYKYIYTNKNHSMIVVISQKGKYSIYIYTYIMFSKQ